MAENIPLKEDPDVKMPASVRASIERSNALFNAQQDANGQTYQEHREANGLPGAGEVAHPEGAEGQPEDQTPQTETQTPAPQNPRQAPQPATEAEGDSWEHKYKSMHGRHQKAQEQIATLSNEVRQLQQVMATMATPVAPSPIEGFTQPGENLLTPEEVSDYGEDFLNVVGRKAKQEVAPLLSAYQQEIARLQAQVSGVTNGQRMTVMEQMYQTLEKELPNWGEINTNPDFGAWLALPDPFSGAIRKDMLSAAHSQGNASRVLAFFNGFLADEAASTPAGDGPVKGTTVPKVPLATFAAPGRAKAAAPNPAAQEKPVITRAQIASFYADVASGKYQKDVAEKDRLEKMIFSAQAEGRIR